MSPRTAVVLGACLTQFTIIGLMFSVGLFFKVFEQEFGWSRTLLSACTSLAFFMMGVLAIVGGRLSDRYGPRIVLTVTGVLYGLGYGLISQVSAPWHLVAIFVLFIGLGMSTHDVVTLSTIARWFARRRGMMTAIVKIGTALGQVALPPLAAVLIVVFDWRTAVLVLGGAAALILLIAASLMRLPDRPTEPRTAAQDDTPGTTDTVQEAPTGVTFAQAKGTRTFWTLCAMQFLFFPTLMTVPLHIVVHGTDLGLTAEVAALLLSVSGATSILGRLAIGMLSDRIGGRNGYLVCFAILTFSLLALLMTASPYGLFAIIAVYGFAHGGLFTIVSPTVADYFGLRAHGAIFGMVLFFGTIGGSVGPILAGWTFDQTGGYGLAFGTLAGMCVLGLLLTLTLPRPGAPR